MEIDDEFWNIEEWHPYNFLKHSEGGGGNEEQWCEQHPGRTVKSRPQGADNSAERKKNGLQEQTNKSSLELLLFLAWLWESAAQVWHLSSCQQKLKREKKPRAWLQQKLVERRVWE